MNYLRYKVSKEKNNKNKGAVITLKTGRVITILSVAICEEYNNVIVKFCYGSGIQKCEINIFELASMCKEYLYDNFGENVSSGIDEDAFNANLYFVETEYFRIQKETEIEAIFNLTKKIVKHKEMK